MVGKDARSTQARSFNWKLWGSFLLGTAIVGAACLAMRHFGRPGSANAQAPAGNPAGQPAPQQPGRVAGPIAVLAVVNGQQISRQYLAEECIARYGKDVLETLVNKTLILEATRRQGVTITQQDVDDEIARLAKTFGLDVDRYLLLLETERNISPQQYSRDMIWPTLAMRHLVRDQITVSPTEIRQALESEIGPQVKVRMIVSDTQEEAEQLRSQAAADPAKFGTLAKNFSKDETSASGYGWMPPIRLHMGDPELERVAFSLQKGDISPVVQVRGRFVILKCEEQVPGTDESKIEEAQRRAFHERIINHLRDQKLRDVAQSVFKQLQQESKPQIVLGNRELQEAMPGVAAVINGQQISMGQLAEECIVRHGVDVLDGEINRLLLTQELARRQTRVEKADLDAEVARAAESMGFPNVETWLEEVKEQDGVSVDVYVADAVWPSVALKKIVARNVEVTEEDMRKGFEANYGPRVETLAIVLSSHRQAQQVWEMARNNPTDQFFGELAHQYSIEPVSRANYGRVPPVQRYGGRPNIEKAAFDLAEQYQVTQTEQDKLSGIVAVGDKFIVMRFLGMTKPVVNEYEAVKELLYNDIKEKKMRLEMGKEFDRLKEVAQIDNFLAGTSQSGQLAQKPAAAPRGRIGNRLPFGAAQQR